MARGASCGPGRRDARGAARRLNRPRVPAERALDRLVAELDYTDLVDVVRLGLHDFLDAIQDKLNGLGDEVTHTFFARVVRITVRHRTSYAFDAPVYLEPHVIRLRPRADGVVRLVDFALEIDPEPVVRAENLDPEGNVVTRAWFEGRWSGPTLRTRAVVDTLVTDPFRFLVTEPDRPLSCAYAPDLCERLALYRRPPDAAHPAVRELAVAAAEDSERDPARFPLVLAQRLAARFASGYAHSETADSTELHAWGEVFLRGGGWRSGGTG